MKKILLIVALCTLLSSVSFAWGKKTKTLQLKGSDTILGLGNAVAEKYMEKNKKNRVAVTGGGSGTGIAALLNKTVDVAMASRPMKSKEIDKAKSLGIDPKEWTIAFDGITVIVNKSNNVSELTSEQIRAIFVGDVTNWNEVGGKDAPIITLSRDNSSGTHVFFKEHILRRGKSKGTEEYRKDVLYLPSNQAISSEVEKNENAIGYIGMGYMDDTVKAVNVDGVAASVENVSNKTYPISRGLYWYTDGETKGDLKQLIDFVFSEEGQSLVAKEGFVPVK